ncbi:hypothetical protein GLW00_14590 [Halobacillus litoralis]|uniref:Uncharacterized protein n=1 Tax=Halobacillus litoralis TaxID=45668 RepID=A0A845FE75_9BACI|nr:MULTISPECIES: hypothetical protein [Halobacillus]MEC3883524.1 hypothetical protein [Halobacillus sp. HZG1]MYL72088.1 hypothetical protein [Halobacillus litoralis]
MFSTIIGFILVVAFLALLFRFVGQSTSSRSLSSKKDDSTWQPGFHQFDHSDGGGDGGGE